MIDTEILGELEEAISRDALKRILSVFLEELDVQLSEILGCMEARQTNRIVDISAGSAENDY